MNISRSSMTYIAMCNLVAAERAFGPCRTRGRLSALCTLFMYVYLLSYLRMYTIHYLCL